MAMLPLAIAASRDDIEVLGLSKDDVEAWLKEVIPDEYDKSLAQPTTEGTLVPNRSKASAFRFFFANAFRTGIPWDLGGVRTDLAK